MNYLSTITKLLIVLLAVLAILEKLGVSDLLDQDYKKEWVACQQKLSHCCGQDTGTTPDPIIGSHCNDSLRYDTVKQATGGLQITEPQYNAMVAAYEGPAPDPSLFKGTLLSKKAIDRMFDAAPTANSLICQMAKDGGKQSMVFKVVRSSDVDLVDIMTGPVEPPFYYYGQTHCPMICGYFR